MNNVEIETVEIFEGDLNAFCRLRKLTTSPFSDTVWEGGAHLLKGVDHWRGGF